MGRAKGPAADSRAETYFHRVQKETGTRFWINNPTPDEAEAARAHGAVGATTNPTYLARMIKETRTVPARIEELVRAEGEDDEAICARLLREMVGKLLAIFRPLYDRTEGLLGYVAVQGDPRRNDDASFVAKEARELGKLGPNVIIKVPSTPEGAKALAELAGSGVPTIATLGFSVDQAVFMADAYRRAIEPRGAHPPCYITFIAGVLDEFLARESSEQGGAVRAEALLEAGCMGTRNAYRIFRERGYQAVLMGGGARGPHHFTELVGGELAITIGYPLAEQLVRSDAPVACKIDREIPAALFAELEGRLPTFVRSSRLGALRPQQFKSFGPVASFQKTFLDGVAKALATVRQRREAAAARGAA